jgi:hypothetical protein
VGNRVLMMLLPNADLDVNMGQTIPLHEAARRDDTSVLELLLKHPSMCRRSALH